MSSPLISVIMPVFNAEDYLKEAIDSILQQTFKEFELIIINDGSTDNSLNIIKTFDDNRIKLINQKNSGLPVALNNGIQIASSQYIARMDADDFSLPNRLILQYDYLEKNQDIVAVGGHANIIDENGDYVCTTKRPLSWEEIKEALPETPFFHPCVMFRKAQFIQVGGYLNVPIAEDNTLFINMAKIGKLANLDMPLINYRISPQAFSRKSKKTAKLTRKFIINYYKSAKVDNNEIMLIKRSMKKESIYSKQYHYYTLLAKKYLWNNYQPQLARKNIRLALKHKKTDPLLLLLYAASFFPSKIITKFYHRYKNKRES